MTRQTTALLKVGEMYTTAHLKRSKVYPSWDCYAKSKCKWEVLSIDQFIKKGHGGRRHFAYRVKLQGKPKTQAGTTRKRPIKIERVFHN